VRILLTGASSYVGARIYYDLKSKFDIIGTYFCHALSNEFIQINLTNSNEVHKIIQKTQPSIIIHIANYPSPREAAGNEVKYRELNEQSNRYIVEEANKKGIKVIFMSSLAAENPDNIYGKLKLKSENIIETTSNGYLILRPSLIVGLSPNATNDRPFNRILKCLDTKVAGQFDTSWKLQPTYIGHLSQIIDKSITNNVWNRIVPVYIDQIVTQYQIANDILMPFGFSVKPIDKLMNIPPATDNISYLKSLDLAPHTYLEMIKTIVEEIKNRDRFTI
jgi:dTDP-4-dehydrorhamnose reductase